MATFTEKVLGEGQFASTKTAIYTVPALTKANVRFFRGSNVSGSTVTVKIYFNLSGTSRRVFTPIVLDNDEGFKLIDNEIPQLEAGDIIEAEATGAVDYLLTGIEVA